ncbi:cytochrome c biogenesis CcdA family protein [Demequina sp.]|uniref:cytochrome c biogenesis CcdA family protein n=1 Tax=Demequina sp. TaxID=2050685 RepID=UPI0025BAC14F|nr:cytochrome c biogenesis CcdA family protein [Demequina sp.]
MEIGLVTAFLGGTLALLSPCGALLLPAFFASTVGARTRLLGHGAVFYAGLLVILVPLGVGAGALGSLFVSQRETIIVAASVLLIVLGVAQMFGLGFDPSRLMPGADAVRHNAARSTGLVKSLLLGMVGGIAGFCAGPILGAVLTLAAAQGDAVGSGLLLAVYGAGMVVPLMVLAASWQRLGAHGQRALRGRGFTIKGRQFHTTSVATGALIVLVGVVFWATNGLVGVPELVPSDAVSWLTAQASLLSNPLVDVVAVLVVAALVLVAWHRARARNRRRAAADVAASAADHQEVS